MTKNNLAFAIFGTPLIGLGTGAALSVAKNYVVPGALSITLPQSLMGIALGALGAIGALRVLCYFIGKNVYNLKTQLLFGSVMSCIAGVGFIAGGAIGSQNAAIFAALCYAGAYGSNYIGQA